MTVNEHLERAAYSLEDEELSKALHQMAGDLADVFEREGIEFNEQTLKATVFGFAEANSLAHAAAVCMCPDERAYAGAALAAIRMLKGVESD